MRRLCLLIGLTACQPVPTDPRPIATPPPSHTAGFEQQHAMSTQTQTCVRCHQPDPCARCHATRAPRDHLPGFARRPHAVAAAFDPDRCATCHQAPFCADCH